MIKRGKRFLKKGDCIVLALVLALCVVFLLGKLFLYPTAHNGMVKITVYGEVYGEFSLLEERELHIEDANGGFNTVHIGDGAVWVSDADCPDGLCVRQGKVSRRGQSVICLPHQLVITVENGQQSDVDL